MQFTLFSHPGFSNNKKKPANLTSMLRGDGSRDCRQRAWNVRGIGWTKYPNKIGVSKTTMGTHNLHF